MKLHVLGCAGGIGGIEKLTTCLKVDHDVLIDAGSGLATLSIKQLCKIDHIFITHSHLDHIFGLPLLCDTVLGKRTKPVTVHASEVVINALKTHLFNWKIWPDFHQIPNQESPVFCWEIMVPGSTVQINNKFIQSHSVNHTVDGVAYWVHNEVGGFLYTGDLGHTPDLWKRFSKEDKLRQIIVDCSFPNEEEALANLSRHYCPLTLLKDVRAMPKSIEFFATHLKPGREDAIIAELNNNPDRLFTALHRGDRFTF